MSVSDRFSLHRYSLGSENNRIESEVSFAETLNAVAGAAIPIESMAFFGTHFFAVPRGTNTMPSEFGSTVEFRAQTIMRANICLKPEFSELLQQKTIGHKNIYILALLEDDLGQKSHAGKDMPEKADFSDALLKEIHGSKTIRREHMLSTTLSALTEASTQESESVLVTISVPPGAELRIDSDSYRVTLNGQNILYAQSGDWIRVSRDLLWMDVESASGGSLSGSLVYTERYL